MHRWIVALVLLVIPACGGKGSSTAPSPGQTPTGPTRIMALSGNLAFGSVQVGNTADTTMTITNTGNAVLTVSGMTGPSWVTATWTSGAIAAGGSQQVTIRATPTASGAFSGTVTVNGDHTSGTNTLATSVTGTVPTPTAFTLSGIVTAGADPPRGLPVAGVRVGVVDAGPNAGKFALTGGDGRYSIPNMVGGGYTVSATANGYNYADRPVGITGNTTLNFTIFTTVPWSRSGTGDTVFDMPTNLPRVRITGTYASNSSNFVVYIASRLLVNELLGTGWGQTQFVGTYLTSGGVVEIKLSSQVAWSFTEVR